MPDSTLIWALPDVKLNLVDQRGCAMVDFVEPIDSKWVPLAAASSVRGIARSTLYRWATDLALISYKELPKRAGSVGAKHKNGHDQSRMLVCLDEVKTVIGPVMGRQDRAGGRPARQQGDPLTDAEKAREAEIRAIYQDAYSGCYIERYQTPIGYYTLRIWEDGAKRRMIVSHPLMPAPRADGEVGGIELVSVIESDWITAKEAAAIKDVTVNTVLRWATFAALISHCRLPMETSEDDKVPILVRRSEIERLIPPPRGNPNKTGSRGNRPEGDPLTPNERSRLKEIEETYRKAKPDCVIDLRQYGSGYYAAEIFENATRKKMVVTLPLAPGEMVVS